MVSKILTFFILQILSSAEISAQNTILWSVENPKNNKKSYLIGTFHQMGNSFIDSLPKIQELLLKSDLAVFESIDNKNKLVELLNARKENNSYREYLRKDDIKFLLDFSKNWEVPINKLSPVELLIKMNQEFTLKNCRTVKPTDKWKHFEKYLIDIAKKNNHNIIGLETDSLQTNEINSGNLTWSEAQKMIHKMINKIEKGKDIIDDCRSAQDYMKFVNDYQFEEKCGSKEMITRNNDWIEKLIPDLNNKDLFIAVGLLHLYGNCGLIVQLKNKGFSVNPVEMK